MTEVKIYIDGDIADTTPDSVNLVLTYAIKQKEGIQTNTGTRSEYAFEFPATKRNDEIFSRFWDVAEVTGTKQVFLDARIEIDGMTFFTGKCQLQSVDLANDFYYWKGDKYKVAFYGNNVDWVLQLKDQYIYQLPFPTHTYSRGDILVHWGNIYPLGFDFKYILIKWKDWDVVGQVDPLESTPALFIKSIVEGIFAYIGYTVNSTFMSTDWFEKLIMPIPLPEKLTEDYSDDYLKIEAEETQVGWAGFAGTFIATNQLTAPLVGANPYNVGTGQYVVPATGYYLCEFTAKLTNIVGNAGFAFGFSINGAPVTFPTWGQFFLAPVQPYTADTTIRGEYVFQLNAGDTIEVAGAGGAGAASSVDLYAFLRITGEADIIDGIVLDFRYLINRNWKMMDFLKGLSHAFNLVFETNVNTRTVTIEPSDTYLYEDRDGGGTRQLNDGFYHTALSQTTDKTNLIDLSKGGELESLTDFSSKLRMKWKDDSADPTVEALQNSESELGAYEGRFMFTENRFKEDEDVVENPFFAPTLVIGDTEIMPPTSLKTPMIPMIWKENYLEQSTSAEKNINVLPRILVSEVPVESYNGTINVWDGTTVVELPCPVAYMVDYNDTDGYQTSLSFSTEVVNGFTINGLLERFYLKHLVRLNIGKRLQSWMFWDAVLLQNLTFRKKIRIHGDEYILQEINSFSVGNRQPTKTYLLYDAKVLGDYSDRVEDTKIVGKLNNE